ncbi:Hypothetical predicted protein, partial [Podarcis lilfordi]
NTVGECKLVGKLWSFQHENVSESLSSITKNSNPLKLGFDCLNQQSMKPINIQHEVGYILK